VRMNLHNKGFALRLLFSCLLFTASAGASTINASSCSQTAVQSAINSAAAGDTVMLPPCTVTWTTTISQTPSVTINKPMTLQGFTTCSGRASTLACSDNTVISDGTGSGFQEIPLYVGTSNVRITGISFTGGASGDSQQLVLTANNTVSWRIDHCHFYPSSSTVRAISAQGFGLIDHNYFTNANDGVSIEGGDSRDTTFAGNYNWSQPLRMGTSNAVYIEDNEFNYTSVMDGAYDAYDGARLVFRYNDVKGTTIGNHGLDSSGNRSTLLEEIYNNTLSAKFWTTYDSRGGTYLIFNNAATGYSNFIDLREYRQDNPFSWGNAAVCGGTNYIDGNITNWHGYPCRDQVGRGPETAASTDWPVKTTTAIFSEALYPGYSWGNSFNGAKPTLSSDFNISNSSNVGMPNTVSTYQILSDRDFYNEVTSFDGTSGVGIGTLSARPSSCKSSTAPDGGVTGPGYWATDNNTLYVCSGANAWTVYYTPYTYPHPLQNAGTGPPPAPPTKVTTVVH
jgi:hypothetical protein